MPSGTRKKGSKWEIYDKRTGKHVGWSDSEKKAKGAAHARDAAHHGWKPTKGKLRKKAMKKKKLGR